MSRPFERLASATSNGIGRAPAFAIATVVVLVWLAAGPFVGFSDTWQLLINTATTILTWLMLFLLQHTQNSDTRAVQLKLDELVKAVEGADDDVAGVEDGTP